MIGYIEFPLTEESKNKLRKIVAKINLKDFCFLKRKGGDVVQKAHLTLFFGINLKNKQVFKEAQNVVESLPPLELTPERIALFKLGKAKCQALVLILKHTQKMSQLRERLSTLPHFTQNKKFIPHITLAYVDRSFQIENLDKLNLPETLNRLKPQLKIYGPREKKRDKTNRH